ncbi:MAG TPA: HPr(Ser) kinase/phosphatase [Gemmatimonadaceae bacterium]|nr:HPr(Ser) kinase/phosphatase [Gemmatimonadaceae bacterium]
MTAPVTVGRLFESLRERLGLELVGDAAGLSREIVSAEASSPGLVLAGYTERFVPNRVQVLGETEISYLSSRSAEERQRVIDAFFSFKVPAVFVTKAQELPKGLLASADRAGVAILRSPLKTNEFYRRLKPWLEDEFAPQATLHGSLADVFGVGLLFVGKSGIGKSECVLDLVERGHRLVADDVVIVKRRGNDVLIARGHELQRHYMEVRGIGLVDVPAIFGVRSVRQQKRIEVVVQLEEWSQDLVVDRTGLEYETTTILDVDLPKIRVPLNPGKNITVLAEVIALNLLLRYSGINAAESFNERLIARMKDPRERARELARANVRDYLMEDDE